MMQKCQKTDNRILTYNPILQEAESRKRQSFNLVQQDLASFMKQPRSQPTKFDVVDININEIDALHSKNIDRVWYLVRYKSRDDDTAVIPGWKGFLFC